MGRKRATEKVVAKKTEETQGSGTPAPPAAGVDMAQGTLMRIPLEKLTPTQWNPRILDEKDPAFVEFVEEIRAVGVYMPVVARPIGEGQYELLAGTRRHRASQLAGRPDVPAMVKEMSDQDAFLFTLKENANREDLKPLEQGRAAEFSLERFGGDAKAAAAAIGVTERWIALRAKLRDLTPAWRKEIAKPDSFAHDFGVGHLVLIARLPKDIQDGMLTAKYDTPLHGIYQLRSNRNDIPTVETLEKWLNDQMLRLLRAAPWSLEDATLGGKVACVECSKRASCQGVLFLEDESDQEARRKDDRCLDPICWEAKRVAWTRQRVEQTRAEHGSVQLVNTTRHWVDPRELETAAKAVAPKGVSAEMHSVEWYDRAKKGAPGAIPCVVAHGENTGEVMWLKKRANPGRGGGTREKKPKMTLKEKRGVLEAKRLSVVLKLLRDKLTRVSDLSEAGKKELKEITFASCGPAAFTPHESAADYHARSDKETVNRLRSIIALAATFGTHRNNDTLNYTGGQPLDQVDGFCHTKEIDLWERYRALSQGEDGVEKLWSCVARVLARRLVWNQPITQTPERYAREAERVAALCNIDLAPLKAEAEKVYPEPKAWKLLVETEKKDKKAKKKAG